MHIYISIYYFGLFQLLRMDLNEFGDFLRTIGIEPMPLVSKGKRFGFRKHVLQECFEEFDKDTSH